MDDIPKSEAADFTGWAQLVFHTLAYITEWLPCAGNMALVGENRDYLVDVPEELYSAKCLSVPPDEAVLLQHEFQNISDERLACELKIHGHLLRLPESRAQIIFCSES